MHASRELWALLSPRKESPTFPNKTFLTGRGHVQQLREVRVAPVFLDLPLDNTTRIFQGFLQGRGGRGIQSDRHGRGGQNPGLSRGPTRATEEPRASRAIPATLARSLARSPAQRGGLVSEEQSLERNHKRTLPDCRVEEKRGVPCYPDWRAGLLKSVIGSCREEHEAPGKVTAVVVGGRGAKDCHSQMLVPWNVMWK